MDRKIIAFSLCAVIILGIFVGCGKKASNGENSQIAVYITDENGEKVTDESGNPVTELATALTDKDGNNVTENATNSKGVVITETDGSPKTVIVTVPKEGTTADEGESEAPSSGETTKLSPEAPVSTTAPSPNMVDKDKWNFGILSSVGINVPSGWQNDWQGSVNRVNKKGTTVDLVAQAINLLRLEKYKYKTASEYADYFRQLSYTGSDCKLLSYNHDVYEKGECVKMLYRAIRKNYINHEGESKNNVTLYETTYIYRYGTNIMLYSVTAENQADALVDITDIVNNTYYLKGA